MGDEIISQFFFWDYTFQKSTPKNQPGFNGMSRTVGFDHCETTCGVLRYLVDAGQISDSVEAMDSDKPR